MSTVLLVRIEAIPLEARIIVLAASIVLSASVFGVAKNQADRSELPRLTVEAADSLTAVAERVRGFDATRLRGIMRLTGLTDVGLPIRVVLLSKNSIVARNTPPWIAGFADADRDVVVLFPDRIGSYPVRLARGGSPSRGGSHFDSSRHRRWTDPSLVQRRIGECRRE